MSGMSTVVSIREFARQVKRSHTWVRTQIKEGKMPTCEGGIPLEEGLEAFNRYLDETGQEEQIGDGEALRVFNEARARKEKNLADIKAMEARIMRGQYVPIEEVQADAREVASRIRAFCISAPTRYAGLLEGRTQREAESVLQDLFQDFLSRIHSGRFMKEGDEEWASGQTASRSSADRSQD